MKNEIKGIMPALVTPLDENECIKTDVLKRLVNDLSEKGADGFYIGGATGEGVALRPEERMRLAEAAVDAVGGKVPCIVQIASMNFADAVKLAKHAEKCGAAAISATAPLFFAYSEDDVFGYYKKLAESVSIPMMVYYSPLANFRMDASFGKRLFEIDNVTAIKWTSSDFYQLARLKELTHGEMTIMNGADEMLLSGLSAGADGGIGTTYNYQLENMLAIYRNFMNGDSKTALEYQNKANAVVSASFSGEPIIPATKAIMDCLGYDVGNPAFPMKRYTKEQKLAIFSKVEPLLP